MRAFILNVFAAFLPLFCIDGASAAESGLEMKEIKITDGEKIILTAVLNDTETARDLYGRLPLPLEMKPLQNREFYTDIRLSEQAPEQDSYQIGDIGYWTPGNALAIYYGPGYTGNLIIMGYVTSGLETLSKIKQRFTAVIEKN